MVNIGLMASPVLIAAQASSIRLSCAKPAARKKSAIEAFLSKRPADFLWMSEESNPRLYHAHVARNRLTESRSMSTTPVMMWLFSSTLACAAAKALCRNG
jgi:hypothetical protein